MTLKLSRAGRRYGVHPSRPDPRDRKFDPKDIAPPSKIQFSWKWPFVHRGSKPDLSHIVRDTLGAERVDLRPWCGPLKNQQDLGACTGFTGAGWRELMYRKYYQHEQNQDTPPNQAVFSPLFVYWWNRRNDGRLEWEDNVIPEDKILQYIPEDRGATMRALMRTLRWQGVCFEKEHPYNPRNFRAKPEIADLAQAVVFRCGKYMAVEGLDKMRACLRLGYPLLIAFDVFESFESDQTARTGICPMPARGEPSVGGHAVLCVGFDEKMQMLIIRNSWGNWGQGGNFLMPYAFAERYVTDAWMATLPE